VPTLTAIYLAWRILKGICYFMGFIIEFNHLQHYVKACNNRLEDAVMLLVIINENLESDCREQDWCMITNVRINQLTGLTQKQISGIYPRLQSRFGIERKQKKRPEGGVANYYRYDAEQMNVLLDFYCNE
jgi:hypothetical protein